MSLSLLMIFRLLIVSFRLVFGSNATKYCALHISQGTKRGIPSEEITEGNLSSHRNTWRRMPLTSFLLEVPDILIGSPNRIIVHNQSSQWALHQNCHRCESFWCGCPKTSGTTYLSLYDLATLLHHLKRTWKLICSIKHIYLLTRHLFTATRHWMLA